MGKVIVIEYMVYVKETEEEHPSDFLDCFAKKGEMKC